MKNDLVRSLEVLSHLRKTVLGINFRKEIIEDLLYFFNLEGHICQNFKICYMSRKFFQRMFFSWEKHRVCRAYWDRRNITFHFISRKCSMKFDTLISNLLYLFLCFRGVFRHGLVQGDKHTVHPILEWLLKNMDDLKMRAYLAQYLVKVEVPIEILSDTDVSALYEQV